MSAIEKVALSIRPIRLPSPMISYFNVPLPLILFVPGSGKISPAGRTMLIVVMLSLILYNWFSCSAFVSCPVYRLLISIPVTLSEELHPAHSNSRGKTRIKMRKEYLLKNNKIGLD